MREQCAFILGLRPLPALYGEMGWCAVKYRLYANIFRFWNRLMKLPDDNITKHIFQRDISQSENGKSNWSSDFKSLLFKVFPTVQENTWHSRLYDMKVVKLKLFSLMEKRWKTDVYSKPKLRRYMTFKTTLTASKYVTGFFVKSKRSLMAQLITGILPLSLETGRRKRIKDPLTGVIRNLRVEERTCNLCQLGETEDEIHFSCVCPFYNELRIELYKTLNDSYSSFPSCLTKENKYIFMVTEGWKEFAKYLELIWKKRKEHFYVES